MTDTQQLVREGVLAAWRGGMRECCVATSGTSMLPLMPDGSRITVTACAAAALRPGDIILFDSGQTLITHRVLRLRGGPDLRIYEKGDNRTAGTWIGSAQVVGRVTALERSGRTIRLDQGVWPLIGRLVAWYWCGLLAGRSLARRLPAPGGRLAIRLYHVAMFAPGRMLRRLLARSPRA